MSEQTQEVMFPEIDLNNVDAGDLLGVTAWFRHADQKPPEPGWYEVNDWNSAFGIPDNVWRRRLAQRAFWDGSWWLFVLPSGTTLTLTPGISIGNWDHITMHNLVWRGLKAPWPTV